MQLSGARILILGLGFRPEVKEHTLSPAFLIREEALKRHAAVYLHDPLYSPEEIARRRGISRAEAARQAIAETAERDRMRAGLAAEARALMQDPAYVREAGEVAATHR